MPVCFSARTSRRVPISAQRWVWLALCRRTRQIVAYVIGDRSKETCRKLWQRIPEDYRTCHTYSDFWDAYQKVFPKKTHRSVGKETGQTYGRTENMSSSNFTLS